MIEPPGREAENPFRGKLSLLIRLIAAAAIVTWLLQKVPFAQVAEALARTHAGYLGLAFGSVLISMTLEALRVTRLTKAHRIEVSTAKLLSIDFAASFYGLFLPGGTLSRGAIRTYRLSNLGLGMSAAGSIILRDRLDSTVVLSALGLVFLALTRPPGTNSAALLMTGTLALTTLLYLVTFAPNRWRPRVRWTRLPGGAKFQRFREAIDRNRAIPIPTQLALLGICVVMHLFIVLTFYFTARSLGLEVPFLTIGWIRSVVTLLTMIPITFSGIGVREASLLVLLAPYGVEESQAVALGFLLFAVILVLPGTLGGLIEGWSVFNLRREQKG